MSDRERVLAASRALLNSRGPLSYFERRGLGRDVIRDAFIGFENGAFVYPCIAKTGCLLGVHLKSAERDARGKRTQRWDCYSAKLPLKANGKPAKVIPLGMETLRGLEPGSLVVLCCGEEDALSLRQVGFTALSQPGAGLLEPVYAKEFAGFEVVVFYDAGEEREAHKDAMKLLEAGAEDVRVVEWPPGSPHGADVNGRLREDC